MSLTDEGRGTLVHVLAAVFFLVSAYFVHRSFYGMRIGGTPAGDDESAGPGTPADDAADGGRLPVVSGRAVPGLPRQSGGEAALLADGAGTLVDTEGR